MQSSFHENSEIITDIIYNDFNKQFNNVPAQSHMSLFNFDQSHHENISSASNIFLLLDHALQLRTLSV